MRFVRLIVGFLVIAIALFLIAGEQLSGASADAVVNAQTTTVRSPISGTLSLESRTLGSRVMAGETLGSVDTPADDDVRLNDLLLDRANVGAEVGRLNATIARHEAAVAMLQSRTDLYRTWRIRELEAALGAEPRTGTDAVAEIALEAAREGTFLGDGYNDAPASEQRLWDLSVRLEEMRAQLDAEKLRAGNLEKRIDEERLRKNRLDLAQLKANVDGSVWEILATDGETVQRGQDVLRLVDCASTIVTLSVAESTYNRLRPGDSAMFRFNGDGRSFQGTITRLAGAGAATIYRQLAVAPSGRHLERFDVALLVPALRQDPDLACGIGRSGRAFFEARPFDFLRRIWG
ncbi:HlyD family secretion protein [Mesorhizobium marinum]|uniref:HlyD family secretion protein n=1 Tax=Mesorhizobium marinum TaxID=3228790 RepID=A0ABV3R0W8_9HYPH